MACVGEELAGVAVGLRHLGQRGVDVVEHVVQRQTDDADLVLRVGVALADPGRDAVLGSFQWQPFKAAPRIKEVKGIIEIIGGAF